MGRSRSRSRSASRSSAKPSSKHRSKHKKRRSRSISKDRARHSHSRARSRSRDRERKRRKVGSVILLPVHPASFAHNFVSGLKVLARLHFTRQVEERFNQVFLNCVLAKTIAYFHIFFTPRFFFCDYTLSYCMKPSGTVLEISKCPLAPHGLNFAGGNLNVSEGCPLDNLKFLNLK